MFRNHYTLALVLLLWAGPVCAQGVAFDASSSALRTGTEDPYTAHTHTPVGTPIGVLCGASHGISATGLVSSVTYGGTAMTLVRTQTDTAGEPGWTGVYFLGASVPTGAQTVSWDLTSASTTDIQFSCITVTAAGGGTGTTQDNSTGECGTNSDVANVTCTTSAAASSQRVAYMVQYYGGGSPGTCGGETTTSVASVDHGAFASVHCRSGNLTDTQYTCTGTSAADDQALLCVTIQDLVGGGGGGGGSPKRLLTLGVGDRK